MKKSTTLILLTLLGMLFSGLSTAQQTSNDDQQTIDRTQAAKQAQQHENGRVLRIDQTRNNYRVKMLKKSGRVVTVNVDKKSGKVKSSKNKD